MTQLTLGKAARLTGLSKATISRAIHSGKLSATRRDDGGYAIDASELSRVFTVTPETVADGKWTSAMTQGATPDLNHSATPETPGSDLAARLASADAAILGLRELLAEVRTSRDALKADRDDLRRDRDTWRAQAERATLALTGPRPEPERRPWWKRIVG